jgi:molybdopterin/thiamine biosynthesis adenylyltransferase/rhodanese-related sulfurtransferase
MATPFELSQDEINRYSRHLILPEIGMEGQKKLKASKVLLVGTGGLGSPLALYLSAAGVGTLGIVDFDKVDHSNLHRQVIHFTPDVGKSKVQSAKEKINLINPEVHVNLHETALSSDNAIDILKNYDMVIDGTDNFPTRYLVNDACIFLNKINVYGSIFRFEGQVTVFGEKDGPCYRCVYPEPPDPGLVPSCAEGGVIGVLPGIIGLLQANEAIKTLLGLGTNLKGRLLYFDALKMKFRELKLRKNPSCPVCGENPTIKELIDYQEFCGIPNKKELEESIMDPDIKEISVNDLKLRINEKSIDLIDVREANEYEIVSIKEAKLIPLSKLESDFENIPKDREVAIHCKMGGRSRQAINFLINKGYDASKLYNVEGGIIAWADNIDPSLPKY